MDAILTQLIQSNEPAIRYKAHTALLGDAPRAAAAQALQQAVSTCARVQALLSERDPQGRIACHPYRKWFGAHWVLAALADLGYPPGDQRLIPLREQVLDWLLSKSHFDNILTLEGRTRRCTSQEGNALFSLLALGLADERLDELANRLVGWQWPDGGWNCDKHPQAHNSSFMETAIPLRALALYARTTGSPRAKAAAERAAEIFLKRRMYLRQSDGQPIHPEFTVLHYPIYWHYDILWGLKVMAEAGFIGDERCGPALDLLETYRLPGGGYPAHKKHYRAANPKEIIPMDERVSGYSLVDWGPTGTTRMNEFVTVDALYVLKQAGRWQA